MRYSEYLSKLYRPSLKKTKRDEFIYLDKNEPPFGACDIINFQFTNEDLSKLRTYPDPYELYKKLAKFVGVDIKNLLITNGSEQAIDFVFRVFLEENDEVVYLNPSFAMFDVFAYYQKAKVKHINFEKNMSVSLDKVLNSITQSTSLFVLANPNNPTGTVFNLDELEQIAMHTQKCNTIFLLDEAYFHFYNINSLSLIDKYSNLIITRTFSKALGIAGARVGYAVSNENNIELLRKLKPIDEINYLSMRIAEKVIENSNFILEKNIKQVKKWKDIFSREKLKDMEYIYTEGNFILLKCSNYEYNKKILLENKILPKMDFKEDYLKNCFRFSVGTDKVMEKIISLLKG